MTPTREILWNVGQSWLIYLLALVAFGAAAYGFWHKYKLWRLGQPAKRRDNPKIRFNNLMEYALGQKRVLRRLLPGIMHLCIFWGMLTLGLGTTIVAIQADLGLQVVKGNLYLYFLSLGLDIAGLAVLMGLLIAGLRRYQQEEGLDNQKDDWVILGLLSSIILTGFMVEGLRIAGTQDPWASWSPVGNFLALFIQGLDQESITFWHKGLWWFHLFLSFGFIAYLPFSKLVHLLTTPANIYFTSLEPKGALQPLDLDNEEIENFGAAQLEDLTWKDLLDTDACVRCGRCQNFCPAYQTGKELSPKLLIQNLKEQLSLKSNFFKDGLGTLLKHTTPWKEQAATQAATEENIVEQVLPEEGLWDCTTCRSCMEQCPVLVEHIPKIIEFRRNQVLMESKFPNELNQAFKNMENNGNPWGLGWAKRADWAEGLELKMISEGETAQYLYWVGCAGAFDNRNKKVAQAVVEILKKAKVDFGILGTAEKCCGDSARRLGNEYLYQSLVLENIEALKEYGVKKIITHCPHCFNTLKNEYPQFGGEFEVIHHTELIADLLATGQLNLAENSKKTITYHDSCYLCRYNDIYQPPREIIKALGLKLLEMPKFGYEAFCCGAGGGRMWLEEKKGQRINVKRTEEALALKTDYIGTGCPFCLTMLEDGVKIKEDETTKTMDLAELVARNLN